jgi:hypothetical protein
MNTKLKNIFYTLFFLLSLTSFGQEKIVRIVPLPKKPEPVFIFDGIKLPSSIIKDIFNEKDKEIINSVSIKQDSVFDCNGKLTNLGFVKIYTKDSINPGAKKILTLTDDWLYKHPLTKLMINNSFVDWDENTYHKLISLQPNDLIYAKVKKRKRNNCDFILKLKIKE